MSDYIVDIEGKTGLLHVASMYFESLGHLLNTINMDQSTYYSHLNGRTERMDIDHVTELCRAIHLSEPRFEFSNPSDYIEVPEEDGWGTGRIKLYSEFREFLFKRRMFDPLNEEFIERLTGFSRADFSNYRNEDRWIPEEGYKKLFNYFARELNQNPTVKFDVYERKSDDSIYQNLTLEGYANCFLTSEKTDNEGLNRQVTNRLETEEYKWLERAREYRKQFDEALGDEAEQWEKDGEAFDVRNQVIDHCLNREHLISAETSEEKLKLEQLAEYGVVRAKSSDVSEYVINLELFS